MIFGAQGFDQGRWAGELAKRLGRAGIFAELVPKGRVWRATWQQWVQCEPPGWSGPLYWMGKPAVLSWQGNLYAGYYLERGLDPGSGPEDQIMTSGWHWLTFLTMLADEGKRSRINTLLFSLPLERRCLFINGHYGEPPEVRSATLPFTDDRVWQQARTRIDAASTKHWLEIVVGVWFSKAECLQLQTKVLDLIRKPLQVAEEISRLIQESVASAKKTSKK